MKNIKQYIIWSLSVLALVSCNLDQEIEIELPEYTPQVVVECYIENGQELRVLLSESVPYFDVIPQDPLEYLGNILLEGATVSISYNGNTYELEEGLVVNPFTLQLNNYSNSEVVDVEPGTVFELDIILADGSVLTSSSSMVVPIPIDSSSIQFNPLQPEFARTLIYGTDPSPEPNYIRRILHKGSLDSLEIDFVTSDDLVDTEIFLFGSDYSFEVGDTIINTMIHINKEYYDFFQSAAGAAFINGNPFGQPGQFISNIKGPGDPIGIFTCMSRETLIEIVEE